MTEDTLLPFDLPAVQRKKVTADFAGGSISSDGGLVLLRAAERRLGLAEALAGCIREWRASDRVVHTLSAMLRFRMFAIACGYEDADDCDDLRADPLFKLAVGRAPESGRALCSQPTMSRLENAPSRTEVGRLTAALVDIFCRSFASPPAAITLDIDDTCDPVHGHQQLSLFHGHYDTRCFLPVHVYHVESGKPVAVLLRPGKTPSGAEVRILIKHLVGRIRRHWPRTRLTFRGDSHYGRREAMGWCEDKGPTRLRPHLLPEPARQPVPAGPPHRRLLADARAPRRGAAPDAARLVRVRHPPPEIAQDRRPGDREGRPRPHSLRLGLSRRRPVPPADRPARHFGTLTAGAPCPANPRPSNPQPRHRKPQTPAPQRR